MQQGAHLREALHRVDVDRLRELLRALGAHLHIEASRTTAAPATAVASPALPGAIAQGGLGSVAVKTSRDALVAAIHGAVAAGLPAVVVYAFDEPWALGEAVRSSISRAFERTYALVADVWAFRVAPATAGWPPHRGVADATLERAVPEVLNVWVALTDAGVERSCMHAVLLHDDPAYPDQLDSVAISIPRPFPVAAETALVWNANLLHWGGACAADAAGPRVSITFTLVRADALERFAWPPVEIGALHLAARLDLIASQIVTYGAGQTDVSPEILDWAYATCALRAAAERNEP